MPIIDKTIKLFLFFPVVQTGSQTSDVLYPHLYIICIVIVDLLWSSEVQKSFYTKIFFKVVWAFGFTKPRHFWVRCQSDTYILDDWWNGYLCYYRKVSRGFSQYSAVLCKIFSVNQYLTSWGFGATAISLLIMSLIYWMDVQYSMSYLRCSFSKNFNISTNTKFYGQHW